MDGASFLSSGSSIGYRSSAAPEEAGAAACTQKSLTPILDRFKALLKEREEIRVSSDAIEIPAPGTEEIVELYEVVLSELTINSKPIITDLTIIAGEQREHGEGIADAICARIVEVPVEQKLPSLYLLDSIVKNIGREYVRHFSARLPEVFCAAYRQVHPNMHPSMRHLFGTWSTVFPSSVLRKIEAQLQFSPSTSYQSSGLRNSESPRPAHGIHVNPKYLEARHQLEHSTTDSRTQHTRTTSTSKILRKPAVGFDEYESDSGEVLPSHLGSQMLGLTNRVGRPPFGIGHVRPPSPALDGFAADDSPRRVVEGASPSHSGYGCRPGGMSVRDEDLSDWRKSQLTDGTSGRFDTSAVRGPTNRFDMQRPRALIDAYGTDERNKPNNQKLLQANNMTVNGLDSKAGGPTWQNTEEEEFKWEDMSPTLADHGRSKDFFSSSIPVPGNSRMGHGFGAHQSAHMKADLSRHSWSTTQEPFPSVSDPSAAPNIAVPLPDHGLKRKFAGFHEPSDAVSHFPQDAWEPSRSFNPLGNGVKSQMPFSATLSSHGQKPLLIDSFPGTESRYHLPSRPRLNSSKINMNPEVSVPASTGAWLPAVNMQKSQPLPFQKHIRSRFDMLNASSLAEKDDNPFLHQQQFDASESRAPSQLPQLPNQQAGLVSNQQIPGPNTTFPPQLSLPQEVRPNIVPPGLAFNPSRPMIRGYTPQRFDGSMGAALNPVPSIQSSMPLHLHGVGTPPLPPGLPPSLSLMPNPRLPALPAGGALSGLFNSLVAQGLLSLTNPTPEKDSVGLEFDPEVLKIRHESAITALYAALPRQCKTCGLRFKLQEEHSNHMDWHVTKNRVSKNRKQKPSRKWFANVSMWLSSAEAFGGDSIPGFLLPSENVVEKKDDEDMAVPADEDQSVCALCGESFDDFYSDETEEWMYRGAVYMNAPTGSTVGMDRSQLGPIVHAKCRSESSPDDFGNSGGQVSIEEGDQRKHMRS